MGKTRPFFVYFRPFLITISIIQIENSIDVVLGMRTRGHNGRRRRYHGGMAAAQAMVGGRLPSDQSYNRSR